MSVVELQEEITRSLKNNCWFFFILPGGGGGCFGIHAIILIVVKTRNNSVTISRDLDTIDLSSKFEFYISI